MRSLLPVFILSLALLACSRQEADQVPAAVPEGPSFQIAFSSPTELTVPEGSPITVTQGGQGLRLAGRAPSASSNLQTEGASLALGLENEAAFSGRLVRITLNARGLDGATEFDVAYSTNGSGNSGWLTVPLSNDLQEHSVDFAVPAVIQPLDDFIGINPPATGAMEIQSIRVEIVVQTEDAASDDPDQLRQ